MIKWQSSTKLTLLFSSSPRSDVWDGGAIVQIQSDDDGGIVAVLVDAADNATAPTTAHLFVYNGQTGAVQFSKDLNGVSASDGQLAVTPSGELVGWFINVAGIERRGV